MYSLFGKCSVPYQPSLMRNLSNVYSCINSSKVISQHRLNDKIEDCFYGDDESYTESCSLNNSQHRFKCMDKNQNTVCLSHIVMGNLHDDCMDRLDEIDLNGQQSSKIRISFETMCDGFTELLPILINGTYETDETECFDFPCNNTYTRCDGYWNCLNGADEVNCEWPPLCPLFHHMCISKLTNNLTCLSIEHANDGNIDCFGSLDERQFCRETESNSHFSYRCDNANQCITSSYACDKYNLCPYSFIPEFCTIMNIRYDLCKMKNFTHLDQLFCVSTDLGKQTILHLSLTVNSSAEWTVEESK